MTAFLIRRVIQMCLVLLVSAIVSYSLLYVAPGGPLLALQQKQQGGADRVDAEDIARIKARYELDLHLVIRFTRWFAGFPTGPITIGGQQFFADAVVGCAIPGKVRLTYADGTSEIIEEGCEKPVTLAELSERRHSRGVLFGDFGLSQHIARDQPISDLIWSRLPATVTLMGVSTLLAILIAIPIGIYSAVRQYSRFDYIMTTVAFVGSSLPTFFFGIMAILILSIMPTQFCKPDLPPIPANCLPMILPSGNLVANRDYDTLLFGHVTAESPLDYVLHFIMPCAVLAFVSIALWSRCIRSSMLEVLQQDYVRTARAKGVLERLVILKHAFRNALIPFITLIASILPILFAGAAITEAVFNWPGLGLLLIDALNRSDYTVAMALLYITIILQLIGYLISDMLYTVADPRIRLG
jgi:peptide/nickel transport system permease protein